MKPNDHTQKLSQLVAKSWADEAFKHQLLSDPATVLNAEGIELPAGVTLQVLENTDQLFHLVLPLKPTELSDDALDRVSGGICLCTLVLDPEKDPYRMKWPDKKRL